MQNSFDSSVTQRKKQSVNCCISSKHVFIAVSDFGARKKNHWNLTLPVQFSPAPRAQKISQMPELCPKGYVEVSIWWVHIVFLALLAKKVCLKATFHCFSSSEKFRIIIVFHFIVMESAFPAAEFPRYSKGHTIFFLTLIIKIMSEAYLQVRFIKYQSCQHYSYYS